MISRSEVIAIIENKRLSAGKHNLSAEYTLADVQEKIERLNTAYDVDKVLEQLEILRKDKYVMSPIMCYALDKAIEIVKAGGISEDN